MQREIKFRVWSVKEGLISSPFTFKDIMSDESFGMIITPFVDVITGVPVDEIDDNTKYVLMQYTGLKDEKGREIYEGDILFQKYGIRLNEIIVVKYEGASFVCKDNEGKYSMLYEVNDFFEIIGNIHQNPELLTK